MIYLIFYFQTNFFVSHFNSFAIELRIYVNNIDVTKSIRLGFFV